jgi:hypothetical protein
MQNFSEKHVGAVCTGLATLTISYAAEVPRWHLVLLPLLLMLVYYLIFRDGDVERPRWSTRPLGRAEFK